MTAPNVMDQPVVYDKAKWHYEGDYPSDLQESQAFVHTGMFLGWLIDHDLISDEFADDSADGVAQFRRREVTGPEVFQSCDGALVDDMLSDEGNAFAQYYFDFERGKFVQDYEELLSSRLPTMYHVEDTWANYDTLKKRIDERYSEWKRTKRK